MSVNKENADKKNSRKHSSD